MTTTYLVHWAGVSDDVRVLRFASKAEAKAHELPADRSGFEVASEVDIMDAIEFSRSTLTRIYNALADQPVTKMESQEVAGRRLFQLLTKKFASLPLTTPKESTMEAHTETHTEPAVTKAAAKAAAAATKAAATEAKKAEKATEAKAAKATATTGTTPKPPGVIATLKELLQEGGGTVDELFTALKDRFPDRATEDGGMLTTIKVQLQALPKKGFAIDKVKNEDGKTVYTAAS